MFLIQDQHRLPLQSAVAGEGSGVWAIVEQLAPGAMLVLRVSAARARGIPRVIWMELASAASSLDQFIGGGNVLRGSAIVSTRLDRPAEEWHLDPLSEIRVGATEFSELDRRLMTVTQFTTTQGRKFSVPGGFADRYARGRRVWHASSPAADLGP
ncbi:hypothetical protein DWV00_09505 [Trinickia dinghuensis]|uniref:Uncharacterized protein n=1 Tax=Trinickia dinghuensis TaxID=2291023 RepID=A0A3D8K3A7_9BURK|nr:hypothetical protein DWV00_09505 [Trinickia dinghuensis]